MKRFIRLFLLFMMPFIIVFGAVFVVDPYDFFRDSQNSKKREFALSMDHGIITYPLDYRRNQKENVIFGESRANIFDIGKIPEKNWCKMSFAGTPMPAILKSFWYVAKFKKVKNIVILIDVYSYCAAANTTSSAFDEVEDMIRHPHQYFTSKLVLQTLYGYLFDRTKEDESEVMNDSFWMSQLEHGRTMCASISKNPVLQRKTIDDLNSVLREIKDYCDDNDICIKIITPAVSADLSNIFVNESPGVYDEALKSLVAIFSVVYDFGYSNEFTENKDNYKDPFHLKNSDIYINSLWKGRKDYYRIVDKTNIDYILENKKR